MKLFFKINYYFYNNLKNWFIYIKSLKVWQRVIYFTLLFLLFCLPFISSIIFILLLLVIFFIKLLFYMSNVRYNKSVQGNGIIVGNRGSGKGMLLQIHAKYVKTYFSNVDNGYNYMPLDINEYINSLAPNTIINAINNDIIKINKLAKYEGVPILLDDTTLYWFLKTQNKVIKKHMLKILKAEKLK